MACSNLLRTPRFAFRPLKDWSRLAICAAVVTQPDRRVAAEWNWQSPSERICPFRLGLSIVQPDGSRQRGIPPELSELHPDAIIVVGYGRIIPQWMIDLRAMGISTCMLPYCRSTAERLPFSGQLRRRNCHWRTTCESTLASIQVTF